MSSFYKTGKDFSEPPQLLMVPMVRICSHAHTLAAREAGEPVLVLSLTIVEGGASVRKEP